MPPPVPKGSNNAVFQNVGVFELPWEDDTVNRLGATYVIIARRR